MLGAGLHGGAGLRRRRAGALAFVVVQRRPVFGAGDRERRAAPRRQHDQRRAFAQAVVQPRQPVDIIHRRAEFRFQEQQHPLEHGARHIQRLGRAGQRLAAGVSDHLRRDPRRQNQGLAEFEGKILDVGGERRHFQDLDRALGARGGNSRRRPQRRFRQIVQDQRALAGAGAEKHVADLRGIGRLHRQIRRHPLLRLARRLDLGGGYRRRRGNRRGDRYADVAASRVDAELRRDDRRRARIDREPRPHRGAGRIVDFVDQAGGEFDELPRLFRAVRVGLHIEVGQHAQQGRANIDAFPAGQNHQPVKAGEHRRSCHVCVRD